MGKDPKIIQTYKGDFLGNNGADPTQFDDVIGRASTGKLYYKGADSKWIPIPGGKAISEHTWQYNNISFNREHTPQTVFSDDIAALTYISVWLDNKALNIPASAKERTVVWDETTHAFIQDPDAPKDKNYDIEYNDDGATDQFSTIMNSKRKFDGIYVAIAPIPEVKTIIETPKVSPIAPASKPVSAERIYEIDTKMTQKEFTMRLKAWSAQDPNVITDLTKIAELNNDAVKAFLNSADDSVTISNVRIVVSQN